MDDCIFCKIIKGDIPAYKVYEDDDFVVILDRFPGAVGHMLIVPKTHADDVFDLDDGVAARLFPLAKRAAKALKAAQNCDGVNILQNNGVAAGQTVGHLHTHVIPRQAGDGVKIGWKVVDLDEGAFERVKDALKDF